MTRFRPCIDLHAGVVKQIVGGSLRDDGAGLRTNFVASQPPEHFARLYRQDDLVGSHVIMLGPGNEAAARAALAAWPGGMQVGGGITAATAADWIGAGAAAVIITSWLFPEGRWAPERLAALHAAVGRARLVIDLSCRRVGSGWHVATDRWQRITDHALTPAFLAEVGAGCAELLIHAADVEGLCRGIDQALVEHLAAHAPVPTTYAGGARNLDDLALIERCSGGRIDATVGSALDLFGGTGLRYADAVAWNRGRREPPGPGLTPLPCPAGPSASS